MNLFVALLFLCATAAAQNNVVLTGTVQDAATHERLTSANIRVLGTSQGTVANTDGMYRLMLWPGKRTIVASSLGYKPDTLQLMVTHDETHHFALTPSDIILPEVIVSSEDPAIEIIRRAIANKRKWIERLKNYAMDAFTRQVVKRDTAIASITESFTKGYWQQGDTLREIIKQRRQTENVKSEFNSASVGRILNFNDDEIRFVGYTFVGPTADDALDYYDYKLQRTRASFGKEIYDIRMIPLRKTTPLFDGTINVAGDTYALMGVDVRPNVAFSLPFVKESALRYRQQFSLYENFFWMPADIRIDAEVKIGFAGISIPKIGFTQTSVITDYDINTAIPDSIFKKQRLSIDSSATATLDTTFWRTNAVLPLTLEEQHAYATLDSTSPLDVQFRPRGFAISLGGGDGKALSAINYLDVSFNRVEGFHLGGKLALDTLSNIVAARGGIAYGFSDKRFKYNFGGTIFTSEKRKQGFGAEMYRIADNRPDFRYYGALYNSFTSLVAKNDYREYYEAEGWKVFATFHPSEIFGLDISFTAEKHRNVQQNTNFSIFAQSRAYRPNASITEFKQLQSLRFDWRFGREEAPLGIISPNSFEFSTEFAGQDLAGGNLLFSRFLGRASFSIPTFGKSFLFPALLRAKLSAGTSTGDLPPQRMFDLESASSGFAPFGVFRAMNVKEFSGTRFVAINLEHNFRSIPFLAIGIPFLYENNIEFLIHGGLARSWPNITTFSTDVVKKFYYPENYSNGLYSELGFGFSRIFDLVRADFTWRLSGPGNFRFTLGVANLF